MANRSEHHRIFGVSGFAVPPIAFRADVLDNSIRVLPDQTKKLICAEWLRTVKPPVFFDVALKQDRNLHLEVLGRLLSHFDVAPDEAVIHLELAPVRNSIQTQFGKACDLLGKNLMPRLVTLRVARGDDGAFNSLQELESLRTRRPLAAVGVALCDWRLLRTIRDAARVDFIKLRSGPTILRHPPEMRECLAEMAARAIPIIAAGVFHGGFLTGGSSFDGRQVKPDAPADRSLLAWRKAFTSLCHGHGVRPAHACVQFALGMPGVIAVSLGTSNVERVGEDAYAATTPVPNALWASMKEEGLLAEDYGDARSS